MRVGTPGKHPDRFNAVRAVAVRGAEGRECTLQRGRASDPLGDPAVRPSFFDLKDGMVSLSGPLGSDLDRSTMLGAKAL